MRKERAGHRSTCAIYTQAPSVSTSSGSPGVFSAGVSASTSHRRSSSGTAAAYLVSPIQGRPAQGSLNRSELLELEAQELLGAERDSLYGGRKGLRSACGACLTVNGYDSSGQSSPTSSAPSSCGLTSLPTSGPTSLDALFGPHTRAELTACHHRPSEPTQPQTNDTHRHGPARPSTSPPAPQPVGGHVAADPSCPVAAPSVLTKLAMPETAAEARAAAAAAAVAAGAASVPAAVRGDEDGPFQPREFHPLDVQLARMLAAVTQPLSASPAKLLQVMLNFAPEDYQDLVSAVVESGGSHVDLLACHLHNLRTMAEEAIEGTEDDNAPSGASAEGAQGAPTSNKAARRGVSVEGDDAWADAAQATAAAPQPSPMDLEDAEASRAAREAIRASILAQYRRVACRLIETALDMAQAPPQQQQQQQQPPPPPLPRGVGGGSNRSRPEPSQGRNRGASAAGAAVPAAAPTSRGAASSRPLLSPSAQPSQGQVASPFAGRGSPPPPPPLPRAGPLGVPPSLGSPVRSTAPGPTSATLAAAGSGGLGDVPAAAPNHGGSTAGSEAQQLVSRVLQLVAPHLVPGTAAEVVRTLTAHGLAASGSLPAPLTTSPAAAVPGGAAWVPSPTSRPVAAVVAPAPSQATVAMQAAGSQSEVPIALSARGRSLSLSAVSATAPASRGGQGPARGNRQRGTIAAPCGARAHASQSGMAMQAPAPAVVPPQQQWPQVRPTAPVQRVAAGAAATGRSWTVGAPAVPAPAAAAPTWDPRHVQAVLVQQQQRRMQQERQQQEQQQQLQLLELLAASEAAESQLLGVGMQPGHGGGVALSAGAGIEVGGGVGGMGLGLSGVVASHPAPQAAADQIAMVTAMQQSYIAGQQPYGAGSAAYDTALWGSTLPAPSAAAQRQLGHGLVAYTDQQAAAAAAAASWTAAMHHSQQHQQQQESLLQQSLLQAAGCTLPAACTAQQSAFVPASYFAASMQCGAAAGLPLGWGL